MLRRILQLPDPRTTTLGKLNRPYVTYGHDVLVAGLSFLAALYLRLGNELFDYYPYQSVLQSAGIFTGIAAAVFWATRLGRGVWRYASLNDLFAILRAATLTVLLFVPTTFLVSRLEGLPRSVLVINWVLLVAFLAGPRILYRVFKDKHFDHVLERDGHRRIPVLLIGAGDEADLFLRHVRHDRLGGYRVVGLVDEKPHRVGQAIHSIRVLGHLEQLPDIVRRLRKQGDRPERIIVTRERVDPQVLQRVLEMSDQLGIGLARLPRLTDFRDGRGASIALRPIAIEDLLGRPQTVLDRDAMQTLVGGRRVMVTGAGGTIGSELVRQLSDLAPSRLSLIEHGEFALYTIDQELGLRHPDLPRRALLCDVRERAQVARLIREEKPDLVFHAAAYKHVPIVEAQPDEGVLTNVIGTRNVADACRAAGVGTMVLISTDKAVNPSSVMGATKRLAEAYCQALDGLATTGLANTGLATAGEAGSSRLGPHPTRFATVRFGNVLGSTGSVVPLFQRQLSQGGPLTVTHPEMTRYFMTVREAVELVLQASTLAAAEGPGHIFVLDMGEPVKIVDLARQMIRLAGMRPDLDVPIAFTGLRPGEKLAEELFHGGEALQRTAYEGILQAAPRHSDYARLAPALDELARCAVARETDRALALLQHLAPEYGRTGPGAADDGATPGGRTAGGREADGPAVAQS